MEDEECDAVLDGAESDAEDADQAEGEDGDAGVWDPTLGEPPILSDLEAKTLVGTFAIDPPLNHSEQKQVSLSLPLSLARARARSLWFLSSSSPPPLPLALALSPSRCHKEKDTGSECGTIFPAVLCCYSRRLALLSRICKDRGLKRHHG